MRKKQSHLKNLLECLTALTILFLLGTPVKAQSAPSQSNSAVRDNDSSRMDREQFDRFMDGHREIAEQLRNDPSLVNNKEFVQKHPALQTYLQEHPGIRGELKDNPSAFLRQDDRFDRQGNGRDNDTTRRDLAQFNQFLESHRETAEQLRKDPSLVNNREFVVNHPALQTYMQEHPGVREELKENPNAFMRQDERFDRQEDSRGSDSGRRDVARGDSDTPRRDNDAAHANDDARRDDDATRKESAQFDRFADSHREIAEQLRRNPSLVNNKEFVDQHPALLAYMQDHPEMRDQINQNPNAFLRQDNRFDRPDDARNGYISRDHAASFGAFLGSHSSVAQDVSKDPTLVKNDDYLRNHRELHEYLIANPGVQAEMAQNPEGFIKSAQQFNNNSNTNGGGVKPPAPTTDAKPKL
jgi:hypothetical protein